MIERSDSHEHAADRASQRGALRLLYGAAIAVAVFALIGATWMVVSAVQNPDVRARQPGWFEGVFDFSFWIPLTLTFVVGCVAVVFVYLRAARRVRQGNDLYEGSFRDRRRRQLEDDYQRAQRSS